MSLIAASLAAASQGATAPRETGVWHGFMGRCQSCIDAAAERMSLPLAPAGNGLVYFVVGEWATAPSMWVVDLDDGRISKAPYGYRLAHPAAPEEIVSARLDPAALAALRQAATSAWSKRPLSRRPNVAYLPFPPTHIPGGDYELALFAGERVLLLDPFDARFKRLISSIEDAAAALDQEKRPG